MNTTALQAAFSSDTFRDKWTKAIMAAKREGFPQYVTNAKGVPFIRVAVTDKGLQVITRKQQVIPFSVWARALKKSIDNKAVNPQNAEVSYLLKYRAG